MQDQETGRLLLSKVSFPLGARILSRQAGAVKEWRELTRVHTHTHPVVLFLFRGGCEPFVWGRFLVGNQHEEMRPHSPSRTTRCRSVNRGRQQSLDALA